MVDKIAFLVTDASGAPVTSASPQFVRYVNPAGGADRTPLPTISHLSGGIYGFSGSDGDVAGKTGYVITTGTGTFPRFFAGALYPETTPFGAFLYTDAAGELYNGIATASLTVYTDITGSNRSKPSMTNNHKFLQFLIPSDSDVLTGSAYRVDSPAASLAFPDYYASSFFSVTSSAGGASDLIAPTVTLISPSTASLLDPTGSIVIDVTDNGSFREVIVVAKFSSGSQDLVEVVHTGSFAPFYDSGSTRSAIADGFRYSIVRDGGWISNNTVKIDVYAIDTAGNEAS